MRNSTACSLQHIYIQYILHLSSVGFSGHGGGHSPWFFFCWGFERLPRNDHERFLVHKCHRLRDEKKLNLSIGDIPIEPLRNQDWAHVQTLEREPSRYPPALGPSCRIPLLTLRFGDGPPLNEVNLGRGLSWTRMVMTCDDPGGIATTQLLT